MKQRRGWLAALWCASLAAASWGQGSGWVVRPEWVRAHEDFLASDVLAGRGSGTRDEEIAATYVASQFESYGLTYAPGMTGYLQGAVLDQPVLDGKAVLTAGPVKAEEGTGFTLLQSGGNAVSGSLVILTGDRFRSAGDLRDKVVLLTGLPNGTRGMAAVSALRRSGAALILVPFDESAAQVYSMSGNKTRVPIRLREAPGKASSSTVVALNAAFAAQLAEVTPGTPITLAVQTVPQAKPKMTWNALGWLPGTDPSAGTILLTAHLDHLGSGRPINGDGIYNGANDDASGTTAVLELAHALASGPRPRRNVLFVCYGSEELGELGSTYFGAHTPVPVSDIVANLEFEMIGNQDPRMPKGVLLLTGYERSNLGPELKAHGALLGPDPYPEEHFFERSDNYALALRGVVAHTAAGWGTVPTYHQPTDDLAHLDLPFMTNAIQSLIEPVRWLATSDFRPRWKPGGQPTPR